MNKYFTGHFLPTNLCKHHCQSPAPSTTLMNLNQESFLCIFLSRASCCPTGPRRPRGVIRDGSSLQGPHARLSGSVSDFGQCLQPFPGPDFTTDSGSLVSGSLQDPFQATLPSPSCNEERSDYQTHPYAPTMSPASPGSQITRPHTRFQVSVSSFHSLKRKK